MLSWRPASSKALGIKQLWISDARLSCHSGTYRIIYRLPWITIFWSQVGWFAKHFYSRLHEGPDISLIMATLFFKHFIIFFHLITLCFTRLCLAITTYVTKNRENANKIPRGIFICGSINCGIVTSHKRVLWLNVHRFLLEDSQYAKIGRMCFTTVVQLGITPLLMNLVTEAGISERDDFIPQYCIGCNYLSMSEIPADAKVLNLSGHV